MTRTFDPLKVPPVNKEPSRWRVMKIRMIIRTSHSEFIYFLMAHEGQRQDEREFSIHSI